MIFNHPNNIKATFTLPIFSSSRRFSARALVATQKPQTATRQHCDAMSSCRPKCIFFVNLLFFLWSNVFHNVREVLVKDVNTPPHPLMIIRQHAQRVHLP